MNIAKSDRKARLLIERRFRRVLGQRGLLLRKALSHLPETGRTTCYMIGEPYRETIVAGNIPEPFSMTIEDVSAFIDSGATITTFFPGSHHGQQRWDNVPHGRGPDGEDGGAGSSV